MGHWCQRFFHKYCQHSAITEDISQELIAIDLNKLTNGAYQLEIVIADTKDKAIMASAQKEFILID